MEDQQRVAGTAADWLTKKNEYHVAASQPFGFAWSFTGQ
jgi:hypothetical protein